MHLILRVVYVALIASLLSQQAVAKASCGPSQHQQQRHTEECPDDALNFVQRAALQIRNTDSDADQVKAKFPDFGWGNQKKETTTDSPPMPQAKGPIQATCVPLTSQESYFTAPVEIGTPTQGKQQQKVEACVDTGSGPLVAADCILRQRGYHLEECFHSGHLYSTTYRIHNHGADVTSVMNYAGGAIRVNRVTDVVDIGGVQATMDHALMLMTQSGTSSPVEGVLGLGLPKSSDDVSPGFLEYSGVTSFSLCFNEANAGSLILGHKSDAPKHSQLGKTHWMLNFQGASVGKDPTTATPLDGVCEISKLSDAGTCSMIPDSGTTHIMLPEAHYTTLFGVICDEWERCKSTTTSKSTAKDKAFKVEDLLKKCDEWMGTNGIDELPDLSFAVAGSEGAPQTLTLSPWSWVTQFDADNKKTCAPAFTPADLSTEETGLVWVVGMPIFYEYIVNFDISSEPYSISFSEGTCDGCKADSSEFIEGKGKRARAQGQPLRYLSKNARRPSWSSI